MVTPLQQAMGRSPGARGAQPAALLDARRDGPQSNGAIGPAPVAGEGRRGRARERMTAVVADGDPLVRRLLRDILQDAGFAIVGVAATGREAVELALHYRPDVILLDLVLADGDGIDVVRRIRAARPELPAVILTSREDDETAIAALRAGAAGYLSKGVELSSLPRALRAVIDGEPAISRRLQGKLLEQLRSTPVASIGVRPVRSPLTPREWEVLDMLCEGNSTDEIADRLVVSLETVRSHIKHIMRKLGVRSRADAVALADRLRTPTTS